MQRKTLRYNPDDIEQPQGAANPGGLESRNPQQSDDGEFVVDTPRTPDIEAEHINIIASMLTDDPDVFKDPK